jgi:hypothetical protein
MLWSQAYFEPVTQEANRDSGYGHGLATRLILVVVQDVVDDRVAADAA